MFASSWVAVAALLLSCASATPMNWGFLERDTDQPVINLDFPDPTILEDGNNFYAFATGGNGHNIQVATASSKYGPWTVLQQDALPRTGAWSNGENVWAPSVLRRDDGVYVMYYSATYAASTNQHCNGAATSTSAIGPYTPIDTTLGDCQLSQGGSIDPSSFRDVDGSYYVVYKVDGNSIGHGGNCNNGIAPIVPTPIQLLRLGADAISPMGSPVTILTNGPNDGPLVEAPSLIRVSSYLSLPPVSYVLFFSSNCYSTPMYDVSYATSNTLLGTYTKSTTPLLTTGNDGLQGPGGATASVDGSVIVYHAFCGTTLASGRCMHERRLSILGDNAYTALI